VATRVGFEVGRLVGLAVGEGEGCTLGLGEVALLGTALALLGTGVGRKVGDRVGFLEGEFVWTTVGALVGLAAIVRWVGAGEGRVDGGEEGAIVGGTVRVAVGMMVRGTVGRAVGVMVGGEMVMMVGFIVGADEGVVIVEVQKGFEAPTVELHWVVGSAKLALLRAAQALDDDCTTPVGTYEKSGGRGYGDVSAPQSTTGLPCARVYRLRHPLLRMVLHDRNPLVARAAELGHAHELLAQLLFCKRLFLNKRDAESKHGPSCG